MLDSVFSTDIRYGALLGLDGLAEKLVDRWAMSNSQHSDYHRFELTFLSSMSFRQSIATMVWTQATSAR